MRQNKVSLKISLYFAISCFACLLLVPPVAAKTNVTKEVNGQNVYITISEKPDKPWWQDSLIPILTIISGFLVVVFQLGRQHKNAINLEEQNAKKKLHLEIYQKISEQINKAQAAEKISVYGLTLPNKISDYVARDRQESLPERIEEISNKFNAYSGEITNLIILIEEYEIALNRFGIFRIVFSCQMNKVRDEYFRFIHLLHQCLPIDLPDHMNAKPVPLIKPSAEMIDQLKESGSKFHESVMDMSCYIYDFRIEAQNHLLGELFKRKVEPRRPTDKKYIAVTTDLSEVEKIMDHFNVSEEDRQRWVDALARDHV